MNFHATQLIISMKPYLVTSKWGAVDRIQNVRNGSLSNIVFENEVFSTNLILKPQTKNLRF